MTMNRCYLCFVVVVIVVVVFVFFKRVNSELDENQDVMPDLMFAAYQFNERSTHVKVVS